MKADNPGWLKEKFPSLPFVIFAVEWLKSARGKGVVEQLRQRRIFSVRFRPQISSGGIGIDEDDNLFIQLEKYNAPEDNAQSLGHEIAHTFHLDLTRETIVNTLPPDMTEEQEKTIENFCDAFSCAWLAINGKKNVIERCYNQAQLIL